MAITDWPAAERPREKLLSRGPQTLSDAELLAIFLRTGVRGKTAVDLARDLLKEYGGLRALLEADRRNFCQGHGLGSAKYALLQAVLEMGRRHLYETLQRGEVLGSPADTCWPGCAIIPMRYLPACSSITATGSLNSPRCSAGLSTAPASTPGRWSSRP